MGCGSSANYKLTESQQLRMETNKGVEIVKGPKAVYLSTWNPPLKEEVQEIVKLDADEYAIIRDNKKSLLRCEAGEKRFFLEAHEELVSKDKSICLSPTEYCYVKDVNGKQRMVKGPTSFVPGPYETAMPKEDAVHLDSTMYVKVQNKVKGGVRVERGPGLVFPDPTEEIIGGGPRKATEVDAETAVMYRDTLLGSLHIVQEHGLFFPRPEDEIEKVLKNADMVKLEADDYAVIRDTKANELRIEEGEQRFFLKVCEELVRRDQAVRLSQTEYCYVDDGAGNKHLVKGPMRFIPNPYESVERKKAAITLDSNMYVKIQDKVTGKMRVERGPQLVFPEPSEEVSKGAQKAVQIDTETAVLVRDTSKGGLRLVQEHGLFFST